jgi:hypothetical protein
LSVDGRGRDRGEEAGECDVHCENDDRGCFHFVIARLVFIFD